MKYENGEPVLEPGTVYLRDTRNGRIYQYETSLAQMSFIQVFTAGEEPTEDGAAEDDGRPRPPAPDMTPLERAAEFDRIAALPKEEREVAQGKSPIFTEPSAMPAEEKPAEPQYRMTAAAATTYEEYVKAGWSNQQLLDAKLMEENPAYVAAS
jgi:hypothetical protein